MPLACQADQSRSKFHIVENGALAESLPAAASPWRPPRLTGRMSWGLAGPTNRDRPGRSIRQWEESEHDGSPHITRFVDDGRFLGADSARAIHCQGMAGRAEQAALRRHLQ